MIDLHNRENSLWNVLLRWKMMLKAHKMMDFFSLYSSKSTFLLMKSEKIEIKDAAQDKNNCNNFSPSQHGTACCVLMHSMIYINFSQSGSHISCKTKGLEWTLSNTNALNVNEKRRLFGCPDFVSLTTKLLMARNVFRFSVKIIPQGGPKKI